jgi:hypothetical protein
MFMLIWWFPADSERQLSADSQATLNPLFYAYEISGLLALRKYFYEALATFKDLTTLVIPHWDRAP